MNKIITILGLLVSLQSTAQDEIQWASPSVEYSPLGRGLDVNYTRVFTRNIKSESEVNRLNDANADVSSLENIEYDIKLPIIIKDRTQIVGGFEYTYDYFRFENVSDLEYELYEKINGTTLKSRKAKFYLVHSLNSKHYITGRVSLALNGDVRKSEQSIHEFAKYSVAMTYGWQKSPMNSYGVGIYAGYTLGRPTIYPVFEWNKSWNKKWGFEAKIPAKFMLRYKSNEGVIFYGGYGVGGISYRLVSNIEAPTLLKEFEVRRSDVKFSFSVEKRIYDFIWAGLQTGINYNIRLDASDNDRLYQDERLISSRLETAVFLNMSIFIVPNEGLKKLFGID